MKIELHDNDYLDIFMTQSYDAYVDYGNISRDENGELIKSSSGTFEHKDIISLLMRLGFYLKDQKDDVINYLGKNGYYISILRENNANNYFICDAETDKVVCSSKYFMKMMSDLLPEVKPYEGRLLLGI